MKLSKSVPNHKKEIKCNFLLVKTTAKKGKWIHGFPTHHTGLFVALHDNWLILSTRIFFICFKMLFMQLRKKQMLELT